MPTIHTAQLLIGRVDSQGWPGGINPSHVVWLTENGSAGLHLDRWWPHWDGEPPWSQETTTADEQDCHWHPEARLRGFREVRSTVSRTHY